MGVQVEHLTAAEQRFRIWMWLSVAMYAAGLPLFLLLGRQLAAFLGGLPETLTQSPPWPLVGAGMEVRFWQVLGVSLMAILALLCLYIARDVRRYGPLITALLAAKLTSTVCYAGFFLADGNWAYLVGALTDGAIFLISLALWYLASPADRFLDDYETAVLAAVGDTLLPRGGAFPEGYVDARERCLEEARQLLAVQPGSDVFLTRLMLRLVDALPLAMGYCGRFSRLKPASRTAFFERLESCRFGLIRIMATGLNLYVVTPFFNAPMADGQAPGEREYPCRPHATPPGWSLSARARAGRWRPRSWRAQAWKP